MRQLGGGGVRVKCKWMIESKMDFSPVVQFEEIDYILANRKKSKDYVIEKVNEAQILTHDS